MPKEERRYHAEEHYHHLQRRLLLKIEPPPSCVDGKQIILGSGAAGPGSVDTPYTTAHLCPMILAVTDKDGGASFSAFE
ncbi:MAG: hypothetical protein M3362_20875 [Acidobacteriota bacterium]|nr:hypothetical protein [Acidobacteriota bacterium]